MMAARKDIPQAALPKPRGRLTADAPLTRYSWFRTGGPADLLFEPADEADLTEFLSALGPGTPLTVIGLGSNMLVRDGGIEGVIVHLGKAFSGIGVEGAHIRAGAGASMVAVSHAARRHGVAGLEFLRGIPGTIGGGVRMNAGAYGAEMKNILVSARIMTRAGAIAERPLSAIGYSYRHSEIKPGEIVVSALFAGRLESPEAIAARMAEISAAREASQPVRTRTGGSTFKNPEGRKAWDLIDAAGCRGLSIGDAQVSELHANFLINRGDASAADIEALGEEVRRRVFEHSGILLTWEIERVGRRVGEEDR